MQYIPRTWTFNSEMTNASMLRLIALHSTHTHPLPLLTRLAGSLVHLHHWRVPLLQRPPTGQLQLAQVVIGLPIVGTHLVVMLALARPFAAPLAIWSLAV